MSLKRKVQKNIKAVRLMRRLSQERLASKAGISVSYVSMLERGQRSPPLATLEDLGRALDVDARALLR